MQAVVLVGGEGRRLRPLTETRPKPMVPLVDRPFVAHQIDHLVRHGIRDIVFSCGYRPDALERHFGDGSAHGVRLRYVVDPQPLGTAGAVANAAGLLGDGDVLVLNGDILTDLDLDDVVDAHRAAGGEASIVLTPVEDPSAYGLVRLDGARRVTEFLEKPSPQQLVPGEPFLINAGTYVLSPRAVALIPQGVPCSIEREIFPVLAERRALFGHPSDAYWRDIGTHASYLAANADVLDGAVRTDSPVAGGRYIAPGADLAADADVRASVVGRGARIGPGARVVGSVLGEEAVVGAGAVVDGSVLGDGTDVGEGARVAGLVVAGDGAQIEAGTVVEGPAVVEAGAPVGPGKGGNG
ncbi:MAG: NDP-sugar synthase [Thermoleophilia bacterium]|nr:NDP-sugar synthase [Thermoleophilia bacterium]